MEDRAMYRRWMITLEYISIVGFFVLLELGSIAGVVATGFMCLFSMSLDSAIKADGYNRLLWKRYGGVDLW